MLFLFPPDLPVTGSNMSKFSANCHCYDLTETDESDYCVAAFGIVFIISSFQWIVDGRKNFVGPRMDVDPLEGEVAVNVVAPSTNDHKSDSEK